MKQGFFFFSSYLSKVVKVVFVVNPSVVSSKAVGFISDVLHIETNTIIELSFEELRRKTHSEKRKSEGQTKIQSNEAVIKHLCSQPLPFCSL